MKNISNYQLVYNITSLPTILFATLTKAQEPLSFDSKLFTIPEELKGLPIEIRISLYDKEGELVDMISKISPASPSIICQSAELIGLKLVKKLLEDIKKEENNKEVS